jgi:NADH-quinone oxidoreductase subunit E
VQEKAARKTVSEILAGFENDRSRLIPILQRVQHAFGYLPREAMLEAGSYLGMTDVQIYGVASFYNYFRFTPLGRYPIRMCMGTACHMAGGGLVLGALERALDMNVGGITEDGNFSLDRVACIGCCGLAPVMMIGERIYPKMTPATVDEVLVNLKMGAMKKDSDSDDQATKVG